MAKLVQKSGYIKSGKAGGYMRYIATREGVERLAGNGAVTKGQRELIQKLLTDFPDAVELFEYEDYCRTPTLGTASAFISIKERIGYPKYKYNSYWIFSAYRNSLDLRWHRSKTQHPSLVGADIRQSQEPHQHRYYYLYST